jgi:hypothetical protein
MRSSNTARLALKLALFNLMVMVGIIIYLLFIEN